MGLNPKLNVGDKVVVYHMEGESVFPGKKGVVLAVYNDPWEHKNDGKIYSVKWEDGSKLSLVSVTDFWELDEDVENTINEDTHSNAKWFMDNQELFDTYNIHFLMKFLLKLKESSVVNMYQAAPYLYMGREKIAHEFYYNPPANEEDFEEVLDMADEAQSIMISGAMKVLDDSGADYDDSDVNKTIKFAASKIIFVYMLLHS